MPKHNLLSAAFVRNVAHTGETAGDQRHTDGHGLMLCVQASGSK